MKKKKFTIDKMTFVAFTIIPLILYTFFYFIDCARFISVCYGRLDTYCNGGSARHARRVAELSELFQVVRK